MKKNLQIILFLFLCPFFGKAQAPAGYYDAANGLFGDSLRAALHQIISNHSPVAYSQIFAIFPDTDAKADQSVWDMYSDIPGSNPPYAYYFVASDQCGNYSQEGDCFNREHSFPKSWFGGEVMPMFSDLHHVYPTDGFVNGKRGNLPYGEVGQAEWVSLNGSRLGSNTVAGYSGDVFEPIDAYKGDLARTYFYMATRYYQQDASWPGSPMTQGAMLLTWALDMLIDWHQQDGVSQKEIDRNNAVYSAQGNRNPFIDYPHFVDYLWLTSAGTHTPSVPDFSIRQEGENPSLELQFFQTDQTHFIRLIDLQGRLLQDETSERGTRAYSLALPQLAPGIYVLIVSGPGYEGSSARKIRIMP